MAPLALVILITAALAAECDETNHCAARSQGLLQTNQEHKQIAAATLDLSQALEVRSNRSNGSTHVVTMDHSVARKGFPSFMNDAFDAVSSAANTMVDYAQEIGGSLVDVGLDVGSFAANSALVIGRSVVKVAEQSYAAVPASIKAAASHIGSAVVVTGQWVTQAAQTVAKVTSKLARESLAAATKSIQEGAQLVSKVGETVANAAVKLGQATVDVAKKLGPMIVDMAQTTWNAIKDFVMCFLESKNSLCTLFLDNVCDCAAGSDLSIDWGGGIKADCTFKAGSFGDGFALVSDGEAMEAASNGALPKLPGRFEPRNRSALNVRLKGKKELKSKKTRAPQGSCSGYLDLALDGAVQFDPRVIIDVNLNGKTTVEVSGMVRVSVDALVEAEGSCAFQAERGFPTVPKTKVFCAGPVCVMLMLQMMAELEVAGTMTGSAEMSASADFSISSKIELDTSGDANIHVRNPEISHESGFGMAASASAVIRLGFGPMLSVWPMPGVPVTVNPMMNAELRGQATVAFAAGSSSLQTDARNVSFLQESQQVVSAVGDRECTVYPNWRKKWLGDYVSMGLGGHAYCANVGSWDTCLSLCRADQGCHQVVYYENGMCCGMREASDEDQDGLGGENFGWTSAVCYKKVNTIDLCAAAALNLYTDVDIQGFALPKSMTLSLNTDWLMKAISDAITDGARAMGDYLLGNLPKCGPFDSVLDGLLDAAAAYAAKQLRKLIPSWGLDFTTPSMQLLAPSKLFCVEAMTTPGFSTAPCAAELGCSHAGRGSPKAQLAAKDNQAEGSPSDSSASLLQVGEGSTGKRSCTTFSSWRLTYTAGSEIDLGPLKYGGNIGDWPSCLHLCSTTQDCAQVVYDNNGHCYGMRISSDLDQDGLGGSNTFYTSAKCTGQVESAKTFARNCDTSENWRFLYTPGSEIALGSTPYCAVVDSWSTCLNLCSETEACKQVVFSRSGHCCGMSQRNHTDQDGDGGNNTQWISAHCYGEMCPEVPLGDRFIDLGPWRLAAWDDDHLSIANRVGGKAIVYRQDGVILTGRTDLLSFERSVSAPYHVIFGFQFLQIGNFRLGAVNDKLFSISHSNGNTLQAFYADGSNSVGPLRDQGTDTWDRPQSAAEGIAFGERFLQFGKFRLAVLDTRDDAPLVLSHSSGTSSQYWRSDTGTSFSSAVGDGWSREWAPQVLALPAAHWECQDLDTLAFGACSNFGGFGDRFIQLGKWRLAAIDETHFSISHQDGQTPQIFRSDGVMISGRHDYSAWDRPKGFPSGITFGSAFIQIGNFRLGDGDGRHFTLSHKIGDTVRVIQCFRSDGTLWGEQGSPWPLWDRTAGPATGIVYGDKFLQIGQWRLGALNDDTFVVEHSTGHTVQTYYSWNEMKPGVSSGYHGILYTMRYSEFHCGPIQSISGSCVGITAGKSWIQLGDWRMGDFEGTFSIAHKDGRTVRYYASDGSVFTGPTAYFNVWNYEAKYEGQSEITLGDRFIQLGPYWRLAADDQTLSLTHSGGKTAMTWSSSGIATKGPLADSGSWSRPTSGGVAFGDRFLQVGKFRIGDANGKHLAVSYEGTVAELFRNDAWIGSGPRHEFTTYGRPLEECSLF